MNSIEEALEKDEEQLIGYVVRNTDYTQFDSYEEFEEYRARHSLDDAIENMTAFEDKDHMVRRARKDYADEHYSSDQ